MYFFRSIIIILLIIMSSFMLYQYLSTKKNTNISKKAIILSYLIFIETISKGWMNICRFPMKLW